MEQALKILKLHSNAAHGTNFDIPVGTMGTMGNSNSTIGTMLGPRL